ncbi:helix-turn-helix domain-containing protein [Tritonibacter multivorans]|uniref:helix-turn-helix domain-containing protein n=1 Tax=Tritonibacter multivorans TaxID=928856 RepID=UPI0009E6FD24|nr:helix-turn-helix transcriptional regulator [Tritonibacter multivorans]MDA7421690.1 helix-turn-helix transcriptional regulator [Tritonibacter multivorans]
MQKAASRLGCQQSLVARIESGQRRVDVVEVIRWARALGCDPHTYVGVVMEAEANP